MSRSDSEIEKDLLDELRWDPALKDDDVAVSVRDGVVTLAGFVASYADKWKAERVVSRVKGVRAIANDLQVKLPAASQRPDPDIARAAIDALKWDIVVPSDRITVRIENGWLTLDGTVDYYFQRQAAERDVRNLTGVKGVTNLITVHSSQPASADIKQRIKEALQRNALLDADHITVEIDKSKAILRGTVRSYAEWRSAAMAARNAPGISEVENRLTIDPNVYAAT
jgi:osmotically-inducible protein OsmY